ncbi:hypothetical protein ARMSODRAFT_1024022 [Armillaria solidipes]|uniref:Uncharacterized protein n=1 Tax=Armillaria solidipes TaxID=1076256 RepID=A0A2H3BHF9_9AGAR|nr:hypothetical protein ARMSODRAFT_1024022 [Armillaria solidipes]
MADSSPFQSPTRVDGSVEEYSEHHQLREAHPRAAAIKTVESEVIAAFFNGGPLDSQLSDGEYVRQLEPTTPTNKVGGMKSSPISIASTPSLPGGQAEAYEQFGSEVVPLKWPTVEAHHTSVVTSLAVPPTRAHTRPATDVDLTPIELDVLHCFQRYVEHERDELSRQLIEDRDMWRNLYSELATREVELRRNMLRMAGEMETMSTILKEYGLVLPKEATDGVYQ